MISSTETQCALYSSFPILFTHRKYVTCKIVSPWRNSSSMLVIKMYWLFTVNNKLTLVFKQKVNVTDFLISKWLQLGLSNIKNEKTTFKKMLVKTLLTHYIRKSKSILLVWVLLKFLFYLLNQSALNIEANYVLIVAQKLSNSNTGQNAKLLIKKGKHAKENNLNLGIISINLRWVRIIPRL